MKNFYWLIIMCLFSSVAFSQQQEKLSLEANFGLNGNFFVRSYDEIGGPQNKTYFYKKNFLGSIAGLELKYKPGKTSSLSLGYSHSINKGEINFAGDINGVYIFINDFNIRHTNHFFQLGYERSFKKNTPALRWHLGLFYLTTQQQEISVEDFSAQIIMDERNFKNSKLEEGGIFGGFHFAKKVDARFTAGLKLRGYYLISTGTFEAISLTPTLAYQF